MDREELGAQERHGGPGPAKVVENSEVTRPEPVPPTLAWPLPTVSLLLFGVLAGAVAPWMGWAFAEADLSARAGAVDLSPRIWTSLQLYLVLCASALLPAALLSAPLRRRGVRWTGALGLARPEGTSRGGSWLRGFAGGAGLIFAVMAILWLGGWLDRRPESPSTSVVLAVALALAVAALYEELLFRGFGFWAMERLGGPVAAIAATSLLFAWAHSNNAGASMLGLINTALAGALLGWLRWRSGHLWSAWGLHFGWNLALGVLCGATTSGFGFAGRLARSELTARGRDQLLLSGGDYGPEASLLLTLLLAVWLAVAIGRARSRPIDQDR